MPTDYKIKLMPNPGGDDNHGSYFLFFIYLKKIFECFNLTLVIVWLNCKIPPNYPEISPAFSIEVIKGLGSRHIEDIIELANKIVFKIFHITVMIITFFFTFFLFFIFYFILKGEW